MISDCIVRFGKTISIIGSESLFDASIRQIGSCCLFGRGSGFGEGLCDRGGSGSCSLGECLRDSLVDLSFKVMLVVAFSHMQVNAACDGALAADAAERLFSILGKARDFDRLGGALLFFVILGRLG